MHRKTRLSTRLRLLSRGQMDELHQARTEMQGHHKTILRKAINHIEKLESIVIDISYLIYKGSSGDERDEEEYQEAMHEMD